VLGCLATLAHCLRIGIETLLHGFEYVLVLPSTDAPFPSRRTPRFELAASARAALLFGELHHCFVGSR
jgi:hypothetical protein